MVRHDLRAPLQAIFNASEILSVEPNNTKMRELIRNQGKYVESILDDWNNQTLNGEISRKYENIHQLVQVAMRTAIDTDVIRVEIDIDERLEYNLDYNRILRAITNILKNSDITNFFFGFIRFFSRLTYFLLEETIKTKIT